MMKKIIVVFIFMTIILFVINTLYDAGVFKNIEDHSEIENISIFTNVAGTEDLDLDRKNGRLFISSTDRWKLKQGQSADDGIYLLNLKDKLEPYLLKTTYLGEFHPHGISFFNKEGKDYLFVINHNSKGSFVELFLFEDNTLKHLRTYESEMMCCPNDLVAVDFNKFYVSNDHGSENGVKRVLEDYLRIANSYVLYFDGEKYLKVYDNLNYANGINLSLDKKTLYVAETSGGRISVLDRDITSGEVQLRFTKNLKTGLDNITIDASGNLWIASHPKLLDFIGHSKNTGELSPSQVLKLTPDGENDFKVTEVYLNSGDEMSGSSTALYYEGEVFIGVVFENKLLRGSYLDSN